MASTDSYTIMMPVSLRNPRKRPLTSDPITGTVPMSIAAVDMATEGKLVTCLLEELNDAYGLKLDTAPFLNRESDPGTEHGHRKTVVVGASHMNRIAAAMAENDIPISDLTSPGWIGTKENFAKIADFVKNAKLGLSDVLVLDLFSNSAYMGTDEAGMPRKAVRSPVDGRYHLTGQLQAAPKTLYSTVLNDARDVIGAAGDASIVLVAPFPRYVVGKCCDDPSHITNFGGDDYYTEMYRVGDYVEAAAAAVSCPVNITVFHMMDNLVGTDSDLPELRTTDGGMVWRKDDPVHLTGEAYTALANALAHSRDGDVEGGAAKRPRLSSIVPPTHQYGGKKTSVKPPSWVAGLAPRGASRGRYDPRRRGAGYGGRGGGARGGYGGSDGYRGGGRFARGPRRALYREGY